MNIIILGPQGSGKGTQARLLAEKFGLFYLESGEFLREVAKRDPKIDRIINKEGRLVDDTTIFNLIQARLNEKAPLLDNILLDGYPRSVEQHRLLKDFLGTKGQKINHAILLEIGEKETIRRLSARRMDTLSGKVYNLITNPPGPEVDTKNLVQRPDDTPELILRRLEQYNDTTKPLTEVFQKEGILRKVDGERPIETIASDLQKIVGA